MPDTNIMTSEQAAPSSHTKGGRQMTEAGNNYAIALRAEAKKVVRIFHRYTVDQVSDLYARPGRPSRKALDRGEFFYTHPAIPGRGFSKRFDAARAALSQATA
jgi:hypothetical protein